MVADIKLQFRNTNNKRPFDEMQWTQQKFSSLCKQWLKLQEFSIKTLRNVQLRAFQIALVSEKLLTFAIDESDWPESCSRNFLLDGVTGPIFPPCGLTADYIESDCDSESLHWPMSSITDEIPAEFKSIIKPFHRICERILRKHGRLRSVAQK